MQLSTPSLRQWPVLLGITTTILLDVFWLVLPRTLSYFGFHTSYYQVVAQGTLVCGLGLKLVLIGSVYMNLNIREPPTPKRSWKWIQKSKWKFFFPRQTLPISRARCCDEISMRVLSLVWLYMISAFAGLIMSCVVYTHYRTYPPFRDQTLGLGLPLALVFKCCTMVLTLALSSTHVSLSQSLWILRKCPKICRGLVHPSRHDIRHRPPVLRLKRRWNRRLCGFKILDVALSAYFMMILISAAHHRDYPWSSSTSLSCVFLVGVLVHVLIDFWASLLWLVLYGCVVELYRHERLEEKATEMLLIYLDRRFISSSDEEEDSSLSDDESSDDDDDSSSNDSSSSSAAETYLTEVALDFAVPPPQNPLSHQAFQRVWSECGEIHGEFRCDIRSHDCPSMEDIVSHFEAQAFVVAHAQDWYLEFYVQDASSFNFSFLGTFSLSYSNDDTSVVALEAQFKAQDRTHVPHYVQSLELRKIFIL